MHHGSFLHVVIADNLLDVVWWQLLRTENMLNWLASHGRSSTLRNSHYDRLCANSSSGRLDLYLLSTVGCYGLFLVKLRLLLFFVALNCFAFDGNLNWLIKVEHLVVICIAQVRQSDPTLLLRIDIVPNFLDIFASNWDSHALHCLSEIWFADLAFATLIHEAENVSNVPVFVLHASEHQGRQLLDIVQLKLSQWWLLLNRASFSHCDRFGSGRFLSRLHIVHSWGSIFVATLHHGEALHEFDQSRQLNWLGHFLFPNLNIYTVGNFLDDLINLTEVLKDASDAFFEGFRGYLIKIALLLGDEAGLKLRYKTHVSINGVEIAHQLNKLVILCSVCLSHVLDELLHFLSVGRVVFHTHSWERNWQTI